MTEFDAGAGVLVRAPDDVEVRAVRAGSGRRGVQRGSASTLPATDLLKSALSLSDFTVAAEVEIAPTRPSTRALRREPGSAAEIEVQVGPSDSALVLVEGAGGVYAWCYP
jgi:hypothetical protein